MTKAEVCQSFDDALNEGKSFSAKLKKVLDTEIWYAEHFRLFLSQFKIDEKADIIPVATEKFTNALNQSFKEICKVLDNTKADGSRIFEIIDNGRFILRGDKKQYNKQVTGKYPKGLKREEWERYNHWLLTKIYWQGFLFSQEKYFKDFINAFFPNNGAQPLWAMWLNGLMEEIPPIGDKDDCISVFPHARFVEYLVWTKIVVRKKLI